MTRRKRNKRKMSMGATHLENTEHGTIKVKSRAGKDCRTTNAKPISKDRGN